VAKLIFPPTSTNSLLLFISKIVLEVTIASFICDSKRRMGMIEISMKKCTCKDKENGYISMPEPLLIVSCELNLLC